jgi:hypothetical protein
MYKNTCKFLNDSKNKNMQNIELQIDPIGPLQGLWLVGWAGNP